MTDTRRDFLLRFAAAAMTAAGAGCGSAPDRVLADQGPMAVYGPAPPLPPEQPKVAVDANGDGQVHFAVDSHGLDAAATAVLDFQAAWLKRHGRYRLIVEGHCDERGTREYNLALGERRAASVKAYLVGAGIADHRIVTVSYGKERPAALGNDETAWARNRRAICIPQE